MDASTVASMIGIHEYWVLRTRDDQKLPPERVRIRERTGMETLESCDADGNRTESLHQAPRL
jgi:hypothetical protein